MQPDEMIGPPQPEAQLLQRDARRVGREQRIGLHLRLRRGVDLALEFERLRHRLDDEIGGAHPRTVEIGREAIERVARVDRSVPDLFEQVCRARDRLRNRLRLHVGERDGKSVPRAPGRDIAAHGARADDVHVARRPVAVGEPLELVAQEEYAHEVARGVRHKQARKRGDLGALHVVRIAAVLFPKIDQRMRRRIMRDRRLAFGFAAHALGREHAGIVAVDERNEHAAAL